MKGAYGKQQLEKLAQFTKLKKQEELQQLAQVNQKLKLLAKDSLGRIE